jgi:hypothetical protein
VPTFEEQQQHFANVYKVRQREPRCR